MDLNEERELRELFARFRKNGLLTSMSTLLHERAIAVALQTEDDSVALKALATAKIVTDFFANLDIWIDGENLSSK